jgi:predicted Fe-Mo cluster-binding NifX family protein
VKIAVATIDGESISQHFGQSTGFLVLDVEGGEVRDRQVRSMRETPHVQGVCDHHGDGHQGAHNHTSVSELLNDCSLVVCGGMGAGAAQALRRAGLEVLIVGTTSADDAVAGYLSGKLTKSSSSLCDCHH